MSQTLEGFRADPKLDEIIEAMSDGVEVSGYGDMPWSAREGPWNTYQTLLWEHKEALRTYLLPYHESGMRWTDFPIRVEYLRAWCAEFCKEALFGKT